MKSKKNKKQILKKKNNNRKIGHRLRLWTLGLIVLVMFLGSLLSALKFLEVF